MSKLELNHEHRGKIKKPSKSVNEVVVNQLIQFLTPKERIALANELYRVMKPKAVCQIIVPHWCSSQAYGDLAYQWPPVSEGWFFHLNKDWRKANAPWGKAYKCDFDITVGYSPHPQIASRNQEYQQNAIQFWKESAQSMMGTLIRR